MAGPTVGVWDGVHVDIVHICEVVHDGYPVVVELERSVTAEQGDDGQKTGAVGRYVDTKVGPMRCCDQGQFASGAQARSCGLEDV